MAEAEHAKKLVKRNTQTGRGRSYRLNGSISTRSDLHRQRDVWLTQVATEWGGIATQVLEVLADKHHILLRKAGGEVWVSAEARHTLASLPAVQRMRKMAALDDLGGDLHISV
ncbi:MAG: hypothetical protein OWU33_03815 [Firmicutes bacterium]|nr:hypothetical protein [Bacillota bacterium]